MLDKKYLDLREKIEIKQFIVFALVKKGLSEEIISGLTGLTPNQVTSLVTSYKNNQKEIEEMSSVENQILQLKDLIDRTVTNTREELYNHI
ncbi:MAG: hypothetical protein ACXADA_05565 [Candidatus Hodarchaeales archaeon]|jgi:hypothetical protein